ncbi:MAG: helix-turn-helix domain-containing protein, partial [Bacteroidaceae bacterium]|nr:helix-turn-helix domain-containing protein [Bacteroidaceae bacterium]
MYNHLIREQRYVIYLELQRGTSQKVIAQLIDVSKSTVSR